MKHSQGSGFTLVEILVVMSVSTILITLTTINLLGARNKASITGSIDPLVSDIKEQQIKAMVKDTEGRALSDNYGVHFETSRYILFHGAFYDSGDPANFAINLPSDLQFSDIGFPSSNVIFIKGSGEVSGFVTGKDYVVIKNLNNNEEKPIKLNRFGTIVSIN